MPAWRAAAMRSISAGTMSRARGTSRMRPGVRWSLFMSTTSSARRGLWARRTVSRRRARSAGGRCGQPTRQGPRLRALLERRRRSQLQGIPGQERERCLCDAVGPPRERRLEELVQGHMNSVRADAPRGGTKGILLGSPCRKRPFSGSTTRKTDASCGTSPSGSRRLLPTRSCSSTRPPTSRSAGWATIPGLSTPSGAPSPAGSAG